MPLIQALQNPGDAIRPRLRREILPFNEALEDLKNAVGGSVRCAAFLGYGRCIEGIKFDHLDLHSLLEQLSTTDKTSVIDLTRLMLCHKHWLETVFSAALFLDYFSDSELKQNGQEYENIVVDLESDKIIKEEKDFALGSSISLDNITVGQESQVFAVNSSNEGDFSVNFNSIQIPASHTNSRHLSGVIPTTSSTQITISDANSSEDTNKETEGHHSGADHEYKQIHKTPAASSVVSLQSYASLELGVARLEIMFQKSLKCISMAPNGWRCQELIQTERLLEARRILSSLSGSVEELKDLSKLVLCPGHSLGDLPKFYSEAWFAFAAKRLAPREAISKFDAGHQRYIRFFGDKSAQQIESKKIEFDFNFHGTQSEIPSAGYGNVESGSPVLHSKTPQWRTFEVRRRKQHEIFHFASGYTSKPTSEAVKLAPLASLQSNNLTETPPATTNSISEVPVTPASPSLVSQVSAHVINRIETLRDLSNTSYSNTESVVRLVTAEPTVDRDLPFLLDKRIKIPFPSSSSPKRNIIVRLPPSPLNVSDEISNLSSELSHATISNETSESYHSSSITAPAAQDAAVSEDKRDTQTQQPLRNSVSPTLQRGSEQPIQMTDQGVIHDNIIKEMVATITRGGYVYVLKSADRNLVKIGKSRNVARRIQEIKAGCQLEDLVEVNSESYQINDPERVEKLVHLELRNFRANVICPHLRGNSTDEVQQEHREWFDVPEEVAVQSVQRWREFVKVAYTPEGTVRENWARKAHSLPIWSAEERRCLRKGVDENSEVHMKNHHRLRHERFRKWMDDV